MKYLVFRYDQYYPAGGLHDIEDAHEKLADAVARASDSDIWGEYWHILNTETMKVVATSDGEEKLMGKGFMDKLTEG